MHMLSRAYRLAYLVWHTIGQARYPFGPLERIVSDRDRHVRQMVAYAYRWAPYYRETLDRLGLTPADINTADDLRRLPLISAAELQAEPHRFISRQFAPEALWPHHSGGSTGRPHTVWHDRRAIWLSVAHGERETSLHRRVVGQLRRLRVLRLHSPVSSTPTQHAFWPQWGADRRAAGLPPVSMADTTETILAALDARQPDVLNAYGSVLGHLFVDAHRRGLAFAPPTMVRYVSDALPDAVRRLLNETYGIAVFSAYQAVEALKLGFECEAHCGYHINADHYAVRIVDEAGDDCPPGVVGEVVVSNLLTRGMVLLNCRLGDRAAWATAPCPCGRNLPLLRLAAGRNIERLYGTDGQPVSIVTFQPPLRNDARIWEYQVTQHALDHISVALVLAPGAAEREVAADLRRGLRAVLGQDMRIDVCPAAELQRTGAGKLRHVIQEVAAPEA